MVSPKLKNVTSEKMVNCLENDSRGGALFELIATEHGDKLLPNCSKGFDVVDEKGNTKEIKGVTAQWNNKRETNKDPNRINPNTGEMLKTVPIEGVYKNFWDVRIPLSKSKTGWLLAGNFVPQKPDDSTTKERMIWYAFPPGSYKPGNDITRTENALKPFEVTFEEWKGSIENLEKLFKSRDSKMYKGFFDKKTRKTNGKSKKSSKDSNPIWDKLVSDAISQLGKELEKKVCQGRFRSLDKVKQAMDEYDEIKSLLVNM